MSNQRYVWDKEKVLKAIQPRKVSDVMYDMRLTPSQMMTFWYAEPNIDKMKRFQGVTGLNPLDFVKPAGPRYKKKVDKE